VGLFNFAVAYVLVACVGAFDWRDTSDVFAFGLGLLLKRLFSARHFGQFHGGNSPQSS